MATAVRSLGVSMVSSQLILLVLAPDPQAKGAPQPALTSPWKIPTAATAAIAASTADLPSLIAPSGSLGGTASRGFL